MKQAKKQEARREWMPVPCPGTLTHATDAAFWDQIAGQTCGHCKQPIGYGVGVYVYWPRGEAAKLAGITQEGFRALAVWEKDRLIAEVQQANKGASGLKTAAG